MMNFKTLTKISTLLSKVFAEDILRLLVLYKSISASEAASRLDLHIKTAQDFLETLSDLGIASKYEVYEKKRPYFRYKLNDPIVKIDFDIRTLQNINEEDKALNKKIKEKKNSGAQFATTGNNEYISTVTVFIGEGRNKKERKLSLTNNQGKFLFHLPFPSAAHLSIAEIINKAGVDLSFKSEIIDIVEVLTEFNIIEFAG